jgi:NAD+ synthase (glutamine-hydrolysing)
VIAQGKSFVEDLIFADLDTLTGDLREQPGDEDEAMLEALTLGTRDYVRKCGFSKAVVALSGGIDSALVADDRRPRPGRGERDHAGYAESVFVAGFD